MTEAIQPPRKTLKWWHGLILLLVISYFAGQHIANGDDAKKATPEQVSNANERTKLALSAIKVITNNAKDPNSVKFKSLNVDEVGNIACAEYRAKNSFGALDMAIQVVNLKMKVVSDKTTDWNKHCLGKMYDMSSVYK